MKFYDAALQALIGVFLTPAIVSSGCLCVFIVNELVKHMNGG